MQLWLLMPLATLFWTADSQRCEEIMVPMCKGLIPYNMTKLPNAFGHRTQVQAYRALEHIWAFMDIGCSNNLRVLACGLYLPQCNGRNPRGLPPCRETCKKARRCRRKMIALNSRWPRQFKCSRLPPESSGRCITPVSERGRCSRQHVQCRPNRLPMCNNLPFRMGSTPNMFLQCSPSEMRREIQQYQPLVQSGCSDDLRFFLCGVFMPFCVRAEIPFALPCRELCENVRQSCERTYRRLYAGLPWPSKLQCHRYPDANNEHYRCVMPDDNPSVLTRPQNNNNNNNNN